MKLRRGAAVEPEADEADIAEPEAVEVAAVEPEAVEVAAEGAEVVEPAAAEPDTLEPVAAATTEPETGEFVVEEAEPAAEVAEPVTEEPKVTESVASEPPAPKACGPISLRADSTLKQLKVNGRSWLSLLPWAFRMIGSRLTAYPSWDMSRQLRPWRWPVRKSQYRQSKGSPSNPDVPNSHCLPSHSSCPSPSLTVLSP